MSKLVSELESSDYDPQSFARLHGLSISKLDYWRHRYHQQGQQGAGFVELKGGNESSWMAIVYPNGVTLRLQGQLSAARLRELVPLL